MDQPCISTVRFSNADLPENDRIAMWRDHYCRVVMKLDIEPIGELDYTILTRDLPGVRVVSVAMSPVRIKRTREFLADGNGDLFFVINQTGVAQASARGREAMLRDELVDPVQGLGRHPGAVAQPGDELPVVDGAAAEGRLRHAGATAEIRNAPEKRASGRLHRRKSCALGPWEINHT